MGDSAAVQWRLIEDITALRAIEPAWRALLLRAARLQVTRTPVWLTAWWRVFGGTGGRALRVVAITEAGELVGVVPLVRRRALRDGVFPVTTLEWLGAGEPAEDDICSEYIGATAARGHEPAVAGALAAALLSGALGTWDEIQLPRMSADDPLVPHLGEALRGRGAPVDLRVTATCPFIELPSTWDDYLAQIGGRRRAFVRRTLRDLGLWAGPGGLVLRRADSLSDLAEGWQILRALHEARWEGAGAFRSERFRRFHEIVTPHLLRGDGGALDLLWLEVRGRPVAALYNIVHRGDVFAYQSGRSLDVPAQVRPGIAIHLLAIRRSIERGDRTYDFLAPACPHKQKLAPACERRLVTLSATAPSLRARALRAARGIARQVGDRVFPPYRARTTPPPA